MKTFDENLALLKQFREEKGKWPTQKEKWEGIGNFVHCQRKYWAQKDKNFMRDRA